MIDDISIQLGVYQRLSASVRQMLGCVLRPARYLNSRPVYNSAGRVVYQYVPDARHVEQCSLLFDVHLRVLTADGEERYIPIFRVEQEIEE